MGLAQQDMLSSVLGMEVCSAGHEAGLALLRMAAFAFISNCYYDGRACVEVLRMSGSPDECTTGGRFGLPGPFLSFPVFFLNPGSTLLRVSFCLCVEGEG